jgi:hypothetical protein
MSDTKDSGKFGSLPSDAPLRSRPSKKAEARDAQGYTTEKRQCMNCMHRKFDMELPEWMRRRIADGDPTYDNERYKQAVRQRCDIGGFAVAMTATCALWAAPLDITSTPAESSEQRLRDSAEALRQDEQDAARYRLMRNWWMNEDATNYLHSIYAAKTAADVDAAIDAMGSRVQTQGERKP